MARHMVTQYGIAPAGSGTLQNTGAAMFLRKCSRPRAITANDRAIIDEEVRRC